MAVTHTVSSISQQVFHSFEQEHRALQAAISGLPLSENSTRYTALLLRRLMVLHFFQAHRFLDHNPFYLSQQLSITSERDGVDTFFHRCLLPLFQRLSSSSPLTEPIPALALPLFAPCCYETSTITIPDQAFRRLFAFFATFEWSLSPPFPRPAQMLGPEILALLFEQQIEQKSVGAYYTCADVTLYAATNTLAPYLLAALGRHIPTFFSASGPLLPLLQAQPDRYILPALRAPERLPLETERDFQARQRRYALLFSRLQQGEIFRVTELVSANLDLQQLLIDLIDTAHDLAFVLQLYSLLSQMTILDPTCGAGAFLLAALTILQPIYAACLTRIIALARQAPETLSFEHQRHCTALLSLLATSPNQAFFVVEQSINHNLYGVDIMEEAVEMCQICLFLMLLASVERQEDLPSFSHLSFHIRAGNALLGFVSLPADSLETQPQQGNIQREELDGLLARTHGLLRESSANATEYLRFLTQWCRQHRPFHWCLEFPACMQRGGFSVILGNPPFVEYKARAAALFSGYQTQTGRNLYGLVIERALSLCQRQESFLGLLVPLSICGAQRFSPLRHLLTSNSAQLWVANFAIFPCRLFEGAFQRLSLVFAQLAEAQDCQIATTQIQRWYTIERPFLFPLISYTPTRMSNDTIFPKLASSLQEDILAKILARAEEKTLTNLLCTSPTPHFVYYQEATNYWTKASCLVPFYRKNGRVMAPSHGRMLHFKEQSLAQAIMALLNSSLFYLWFMTYSDGFHLTHALVKSFPINYEPSFFTELAVFAHQLQGDIQCHTQRSTRNTQNNVQSEHRIELEEFHMGCSKMLLDKIDGVLASYYGFTSEELDFIVNYDEKYRLR